ncbi:O-antigen polymerase [Rossellomorea sp. GCM10028870]|uniref:O-antigen polymerase n=1 Tax=Rossellomorea sp. GCM10028870 TaxID=3273426 RepID=UPI0036071DA4
MKISSIYTIFHMFLLKILLDIVFNLRIKEYFTFLVSFEENYFKVFESYILLAILLVFLNKKNTDDKLSTILVLVLFTIHYIPTLVLYGYMNLSREFIYLTSLYWIILILSIKFINLDNIELRGRFKTNKIFYSILLIWCLVVPIISFNYFDVNIDLNLLNLFSKDIYEIRDNNSGIYDNLGVFNIILRWGSFVVFPVMFTYFYSINKKKLCLIPVILQLLLFFTMPFKSWLLVIPFTFILYILYNPKNFKVNILMAINSFVLLSILLFKYISHSLGEIFIILIIRRVFFIPALLSNLYYEFFKDRPAFLIQASFLKDIIPNGYSNTPPYLVSQYFFGESFNANTGLFGDAYSIFKVIGILIFPVIYAFLFRLMDNFSKGIDKKAVMGIVLAQIVVLTNSSIIAILIGHGFLFMLLIMYIMPRTKVASNL